MIPVLAAAVVYGGLHFLRPVGAHTGVAAGSFFHPWQVWWLFGVPSAPAWEAAGHGAITSPAWLAPIPHPLIVALALPLSALWWWRAGRDRPREDALALFALLALERCMLDPWNLAYYQLPLVLALVAWETEKRRPPVIALSVTAAIWLTFKTLEMREGIAPYADVPRVGPAARRCADSHALRATRRRRAPVPHRPELTSRADA